MVPNLKKNKKKFGGFYAFCVKRISCWLIEEIEYLDSFSKYITKKDLREIPVNYQTFSISNNKILSLEEMPPNAIKEIIKISKCINEKTWGIILESSKIVDFNSYLAQLNRIQINNRKSNFFVITDCEEILYRLTNIFNWMNRDFYIVNNKFDLSIEDKHRFSINYHCMSEIDRIVTTPQCDLSIHFRDELGKTLITPNSKNIYNFKCKPLIKNN